MRCCARCGWPAGFVLRPAAHERRALRVVVHQKSSLCFRALAVLKSSSRLAAWRLPPRQEPPVLGCGSTYGPARCVQALLSYLHK